MNIFKGKKSQAFLLALLIINLLILGSNIVFSESIDFNHQMVDIESHTKYVKKMVNYRSFGDIKTYYIYNDGYYRGRLEIIEYWQNSDYSWDVIYGGYVTNDNMIEPYYITK